MGFFYYIAMQEITYSTNKKSTTSIHFTYDKRFFMELAGDRRTAIITSGNITKSYPEIFEGQNVIVIDDKEYHKNLATIEEIASKLLLLGFDRHSFIIGIGGGIVCDIAGFVSHIYMRGLRFGLIPTTLLAMSDAAIGGKNGVNFGENKNMLGCFDNPDFIIADSSFVQTLPKEQYLSGLGEIIKYALIGNENILNILQNEREKILNRDNETVNRLVKESILTKVQIVENDPNDTSTRHILNFGHTIGHSIELTEKLPHGMAVVKGMNAAVDLSERLGLLAHDKAMEAKKLLTDFGYDIMYNLSETHFNILCHDKKKEDSQIRFVLLEDIGKPVIKKLPIEQIPALIG
ncbi:MAG: 3-dehydroquinate synthase [Bacteroidales bacterium]|nr:3-dehydroquinate synthase [Bacteroidales bacterium]